MDSFVLWIFLWLIPTLSLNKIKLQLSIGFLFLLFGVPQHVASLITPFHDLIIIVMID
jgi:hypothetical protein